MREPPDVYTQLSSASGHNTGTGGREEETLDTLPVTGTTCSQETQGCRGDMDHVTLTMGHVETPE